jgi:hypothetical protein
MVAMQTEMAVPARISRTGGKNIREEGASDFPALVRFAEQSCLFAGQPPLAHVAFPTGPTRRNVQAEPVDRLWTTCEVEPKVEP